MTFGKRQNYRDSKKINKIKSVVARVRRERKGGVRGVPDCLTCIEG